MPISMKIIIRASTDQIYILREESTPFIPLPSVHHIYNDIVKQRLGTDNKRYESMGWRIPNHAWSTSGHKLIRR